MVFILQASSSSSSISVPKPRTFCISIRRRYVPFRLRMSRACVPVSTIFPMSNVYMESSFLTVLRRCAIVSAVRPHKAMCTASCIMRSFSASRFDALSSRIKMRGLRLKALAMQIRSFCPSLSTSPRSLRIVWYHCGNSRINRSAFASITAAMTSASLTSRCKTTIGPVIGCLLISIPAQSAMFSGTVIMRSIVICPMYPICESSQCTLRSQTSARPISNCPPDAP